MYFEEYEFLFHSNLIENERSLKALTDSTSAWLFAKKNRYIIDVDIIQKIHYRLLRRLDIEVAVKIRTRDIYVGDKTGYDKCFEPGMIDTNLREWSNRFYKVKSWTNIKEMYIDFLKIHPFEDGNGRTGRILMNLQRINDGMDPLVIHMGKEQQEYYTWFRK